MARAEVEQAERRLGQYRSLESRRGGGGGRVAIRTPIDGTVAERTSVAGGFVSGGERLLRVVDRSRLWLEANVPEADLPKIDEPTGAWFRPRPARPPIEIDVAPGGKLISFSEVIDPATRTAPLIFGIGETEATHDLRIGAFIRAHVFSGPPRQAVSIPASAVLDEKGLNAVYVMTSGESFERRNVRLGIRDRGRVEVLDGVEPGERVVSRGNYYVKLASTSTGSIGHGHSH